MTCAVPKMTAEPHLLYLLVHLCRYLCEEGLQSNIHIQAQHIIIAACIEFLLDLILTAQASPGE